MATQSAKENKFFKNFLLSETERIRKKLSEINKNEKFEFLQKFKIFAEENEISDKNTFYSDIGLEDVYKISELILSRDLDFIGGGPKSKVLELWQKTRATKDNVASETCREKGNLCLKMGHVNEAIEQYNEAVLFAEIHSRPYALALANRAMAWIKVRVSIQICYKLVSFNPFKHFFPKQFITVLSVNKYMTVVLHVYSTQENIFFFIDL